MDFIKITDYAAKDSLLTGDPAKLVKGTEIGADFDAVAVAVATKHDSSDIGVTVQAYSANLDEYAAVNPTAAGLAILDDATASDQLTTLGGTTVGKAVFTAATVAAAQQATDTEVGVDVMAYVAPGTSGNVLTSNGSTWESAAATITTSTEEGITQFYHPAAGSSFQDMYRSGWLPSWFNQQWGGAQMLAPSGSGNTCATLSIEDNSNRPVGSAAGNYYQSTPFKVAETTTYDAAEIKIFKTGNPTTLTVRVYSDTAGVPNAAIGSAATLSGKLVTSKADGEWYTLTGLAVALTAGTQYHLVLTQTATDASNYFSWKETTTCKYPHGAGKANSATSAPSWTALTGEGYCFAIINPAANSLIQSGGQFDYKLSFAAGSPVNQSRSVAQPLVNFYDGKNCSVLHRGTYAVSTNVWDFTYGLDHDRITLTINSSGYPVATLYESDRTVATVTGTSSVTTGFHDVGIRARTVGDGSDYLTLYIDGASNGTPLTSQTFTMDVNMVTLGTARLGDGFGLAPTWTLDQQMTGLPSVGAVWTWTGTGTEASCMSIQNNKMYQNANGYASTDTGYYLKTIIGVNGTGTTVSWKCRCATSPNTVSSPSLFVRLADGTNAVTVRISEYFIETVSNITTTTAAEFTVQGDFKSQETVFTLCAKGSDYYLFANGKLIVDGTGKFVGSSGAVNNVLFGDFSATASANADAVWSEMKYYVGGMILPVANTGSCSEFAHWSGDKSALFPSLYNSGTPVSVKQLCGVPRNYQFEQVVQREVRRGVTANPTTTSTTAVLTTDLEAYVIGSSFDIEQQQQVENSTATSSVSINNYLNGVQLTDASGYLRNPTAGYSGSINANTVAASQLGLNKVEARWYVNANTATSDAKQRNLIVEARS